MAGRTAQPHLEELLSHAEWLRALARRLVVDAAAADDLVQETWLAALRSPPDPERPARPWLAGVLRNLVRLRARTEGRRAWRQKAVAKRDELPSTAELIERADAGRQLTESVLELPEPYRTTVLLRYQHDLSAAEIARRQGVPAGTVRWRLKRGLAELRGRLDARYPDRESWCLALVALEHTGGPGSGAGLASGTSLAAALKVGAGIAVCGGLLWLPLRDAVRVEDDLRTPPLAALRGDAARVGLLERPDDPAAVRRSVPNGLGPDGAGATSSAVLGRRPSRLRVTRPDGAPVAGLPTVLLDAEGEEHSATTDADGFATYAASHGAAVFYAMRAGAFLERHDVELGAADGTVTIEPGSALAGLVTLDGRVPREPLELHLLLDQQLLSGAALPSAVMDAFAFGRKAVLRTDEAGRFRFEGLAADWSGLLYLPVGYALVGRRAPGVTGGGPTLHFDRPKTGVVVELRTLPRLAGRVVEADGGSPVAAATVLGEVRGANGERWRIDGSTDGAGRFAFVLDGDGFAAVDLAWSGRDGRGRSTLRLRGPDVPLDLELGDLALARYPVTSFRVLDDAGLPLAGAVAEASDGLTRSAPTGADGVGSIGFGGETFRISARGFRPQDLAAQPAGETVVRLARGNRLTLRIQAGGAAIAAAEVTLSTAGGDERRGRVVLRADEAGRVEFDDLPAGAPITLEVRDVLGDLIHEERLTALQPTEDRVHEVVVAGTLRTLAGRAVDSAGESIVGMVLFVESPEGGRRFKMRTAVPGTFSIPFLGTETVDIVLKKRGFATTAVRGHPLAPEVTLDIRMTPGRNVIVRVTDDRGAPVLGGTVVARSPASGIEWTARRADGSGRHELFDLEAGELEVRLVVGGWTYTRNHDTHDAELSFAIPTQGAVIVRYTLRADLAPGRCRIVLAPRDSRGSALTFLPAEQSGTLGFRTVRPGLYDLFVERRTRADRAPRRVGASVPVTVNVGVAARVELAP